MDPQAGVYAPARATSLARIRPAIENWETSLRKFNETGGYIDDKSKKNTLLKITPKVVADPLIMTPLELPHVLLVEETRHLQGGPPHEVSS